MLSAIVHASFFVSYMRRVVQVRVVRFFAYSMMRFPSWCRLCKLWCYCTAVFVECLKQRGRKFYVNAFAPLSKLLFNSTSMLSCIALYLSIGHWFKLLVVWGKREKRDTNRWSHFSILLDYLEEKGRKDWKELKGKRHIRYVMLEIYALKVNTSEFKRCFRTRGAGMNSFIEYAAYL